MVQSIADSGLHVANAVWGFFLDVAPNHLGLILVPLVVLGVISLWAARRPLAR